MTSLINLTEYCSQSGGDIKFIFVKENEESILDNVIEEMKELHPESDMLDVIDAEDCFEIDDNGLSNKKYIFVFEHFETAAFKHIAEIKNVYILGYKCVMNVIHENLEVPASLFHIHNLCMKGIILCFSSIENPEKKAHMKKLIGYMGGLYCNNLTDKITHLVTEDIFSKKYHHAGAHGIKIMHPSFIEDLWKYSQAVDFNKIAHDEEFIQKYQLKIFHNLVFSSTGLENEEKKDLIKIIEDNGGKYSNVFRTSTVKVLIMKTKDIGGAKYKASVKHDIYCLDPHWITDSATVGYAVNMENYIINKKEGQIKSSTPTKNTSSLGRFNFDNTMLSDISDMTTKSITIDETQRKSSFKPQVAPKKSEILAPSTSKAPNLRSSSKSSNDTTITSVKSSKDSTFKKPALKSSKKAENFQVPSPPKFEYTEEESDESFIQILIDKTVCIYGYTNDIDSMQVLKECEKLGAKLVDLSYTKTVDYVITSADILEIEPPNLKYRNIVNDVWFEESVERGQCIEPLQFYHHSIFKPQEKHQVLKDEIFVYSNYEIQRQRPFIRLLVKALGGICKEALSRSEGAILICPSAEGKKYEGARNWGLTVLRAEWLLKCYQEKIRYDESDYLVGDSKASSKNNKKRDSIIPSSQELENDNYGSPLRGQRVIDAPQTPNTALNCEDEARVGNISWLLEDMPTPQRETTRRVLIENQKKNKVSPRTKLLKDLMQTPGTIQKNIQDYAPSPAPELPQCMLPPKDGDFGLQPDSSPASQWYYKRKLEALDDRYVHISDSRRKALREVPQTPSPSSIRSTFFRKRLSDYDSPDLRKSRPVVDETQGLFMARVTANMSNEASKFLNFEDTESDGITLKNNTENVAHDSDILKLDEIVKKTPSNENIRRSGPQTGDDEYSKNKNIIDYNPKSPIALVRWSNTQLNPDESFNDDHTDNKEEEEASSEHENEDIPVNASHEAEKEYTFAISSGSNGEEKQQIYEKIEKLGGRLTDKNFTHLIMMKMSKSSKFFSALASGCLVLHTDFIEESLKANRFIKDTDRFEYGNPLFQCVVSNVKEPLLLDGPYRCRMLVKNNPEKFKNGLFTGMKFILIASIEKIAQFKTVIESGGGTIIDEKPEFKTSVLKRCKIDYCLFEVAKLLTKKDTETLKSCSIPIRNVKFIYEYLLSDSNGSSLS